MGDVKLLMCAWEPTEAAATFILPRPDAPQAWPNPCPNPPSPLTYLYYTLVCDTADGVELY